MLRELAHAHPEYSITALIRDPQKAELVTKAFPKVRTVIGDLDDGDLLENEVSKVSIVLRRL